MAPSVLQRRRPLGRCATALCRARTELAAPISSCWLRLLLLAPHGLLGWAALGGLPLGRLLRLGSALHRLALLGGPDQPPGATDRGQRRAGYGLGRGVGSTRRGVRRAAGNRPRALDAAPGNVGDRVLRGADDAWVLGHRWSLWMNSLNARVRRAETIPTVPFGSRRPGVTPT